MDWTSSETNRKCAYVAQRYGKNSFWYKNKNLSLSVLAHHEKTWVHSVNILRIRIGFQSIWWLRLQMVDLWWYGHSAWEAAVTMADLWSLGPRDLRRLTWRRSLRHCEGQCNQYISSWWLELMPSKKKGHNHIVVLRETGTNNSYSNAVKGGQQKQSTCLY